MRIKICGLTRAEDVRLAVELGADAVGFVLAPSRRRITLKQAVALARLAPPWVARVAVMVHPTRDEAAAVASTGTFTHLQLHGDEGPEFCSALALPIVKAFSLESSSDLTRMEEFLARFDAASVLVDGPAGGSGQACDWTLAARAARRWPLVLAGGLTPASVGAALEAVRPAAVDVSSGVETSPGVKCPDRLAAFFDAVHEAAGALRRP